MEPQSEPELKSRVEHTQQQNNYNQTTNGKRVPTWSPKVNWSSKIQSTMLKKQKKNRTKENKNKSGHQKVSQMSQKGAKMEPRSEPELKIRIGNHKKEREKNQRKQKSIRPDLIKGAEMEPQSEPELKNIIGNTPNINRKEPKDTKINQAIFERKRNRIN